MIIKPADGRFWCEVCDHYVPHKDGKLVQVDAVTINTEDFNMVEFAICGSCIPEFVKKLTEK